MIYVTTSIEKTVQTLSTDILKSTWTGCMLFLAELLANIANFRLIILCCLFKYYLENDS